METREQWKPLLRQLHHVDTGRPIAQMIVYPYGVEFVPPRNPADYLRVCPCRGLR